MTRLLALGLVALSALSCSDSTEPLNLAGRPAGVSTVDGDNQHGVAGGPLAAPLHMRVTDSAGRPTPGVFVEWITDGGSLSQTEDTTDDAGNSSVIWTLPQTPGTYRARAAAAGAGEVQFTAVAQPIAGDVVFRYIDAGGYHACGITTTEQLLCWGYNADGELGIGAPSDKVISPTLIPGDYRYRRVVGGFYHSCAFTLALSAYCWGYNGDGRLGDGSSGASSSAVPVPVILAPSVDTTVADTVIINKVQLLAQAMSAGEAHSCAIDPSQHLFCWGRNQEGQLGRGSFESTFPTSPVTGPDLFKEVSAGGLHTCAITLSGAGRCWGYNRTGQLGDGTTTNSAAPVAITGGNTFRTDPLVIFRSPDPDFPLPPGPFVAAGYDHSCGITAPGPTVCWGLNEYGQLGDGTATNRPTPVAVAGGHAFAAVTAGLRHSCALDTDGAAFCWGDNTHGELGDGSTNGSSTPVAVAGGLTFSYIKAGELSTCGVTAGGTAYCWGDNEYGQLGDGTTNASNVPVKVAFQP
jgi:alpha-tubulin suppressor-like RCC1 family protein